MDQDIAANSSDPQPALTAAGARRWWLGRLRASAKITLVAIVLGFLTMSSVDILAQYPWLRRFLAAPCSILGWISLWMLTTARPDDPEWSRCLRWIARGSIVALFLQVLASLSVDLRLSPSPLDCAVLAHVAAAAAMVSGAGAVATFSYLARISRYLGDGTLRKNFSALKWIFGVLLGLSLLAAAWKWPELVAQSNQRLSFVPSKQDARLIGHKIAWFCISVAFSAWMFWLFWRLMKRLSDKIHRMCQTDASAPADAT